MHIKKVKSFTLIEMIVVMALISIVFLISLLAYSIINKQFINYYRQSSFVNSVSQFINTFENDLFCPHKIEIIDNTLRISKQNTKCTYIIDEHAIIRQVNNKFDTLINLIPQIELDYKTVDGGLGEIIVRFVLPQNTITYTKVYFNNNW